MPNAVLNSDHYCKEYVKVLNKVLAVKPKDMVITMHICCGNFCSTWFSFRCDMGPLPRPLCAPVLSMDSFEYDTDRAGTSIRSTISRTKKVVLGLVTSSKSADFENSEAIKDLIKGETRPVSGSAGP